MNSSEDYEEEEEDQRDDTYDNDQSFTMAPTMKRLPMIEKRKKSPWSSDSEEKEEILSPEKKMNYLL
jgi:hypothetical protein